MAVDFADYFWGEKHEGFQVSEKKHIYLSNPIFIYPCIPLYLGVDAEHEGKPAGLEGVGGVR